jgi:excisionase family DNA binding protein
MSDDLLTTAEAARMLRVSQKTIGRWVRLGQLPAVRLPSGQFRIKRAEVERLLASDQPQSE